MSYPLSLRALRSKPIEPTRQILLFWLHNEQFALPLPVVAKVIAIDRLYGNQAGAEAAIAFDHSQDIPVIAIHQRVFGAVAAAPALMAADASESKLREKIAAAYLLVVYDLQGNLVGIPLDRQPQIRRIPESAFKPVSAIYQQEGGVRCVSGLIVPNREEPPIFLLNLAQVLQPQTALPSG